MPCRRCLASDRLANSALCVPATCMASGQLLMLWSTVGCEGYAMGYAVSDSGNVLGPWRQSDAPIYGRDGGHGMLFHDLAGRLWMTLHHPNDSPNERPVWLEVAGNDGGLALSHVPDDAGGAKTTNRGNPVSGEATKGTGE